MLRSLDDSFPPALSLVDAQPFAPIEAFEDEIRTSPISAIQAPQPYEWREPSELPRRPWVYGRQLLRKAVFTIVAPGGTGKTALMIGTSLSLCTGVNFMDQEVWGGPKRVWLCNLEDTLSELQLSIQAACMHWCIDPRDLGDRLFVNSGPDGFRLALAQSTPSGPQINRAVATSLEEHIAANRIDVVIVDPFISSHGLSDENDNVGIDLVAKEWSRIAAATNSAVVLVHHARKSNGAEVTAESARGASALIDAARGGLALNRMSKEDAESFGIDPESRHRFFRADNVKSNRAPAGEGHWFEMIGVHLGNGPDGGDSIGVATPWTKPDPFADVSIAHLRAVQGRITEKEWRESPQANDWWGALIADALDLDLSDPADKRRVKSIANTWIANRAFVIDARQDASRQTRKFVIMGDPA